MTVAQFKKAKSIIARIDEITTNINISKSILAFVDKFRKEQNDLPFISTIDIDGNKIKVGGDIGIKIYNDILNYLNEELSLLEKQLAEL